MLNLLNRLFKKPALVDSKVSGNQSSESKLIKKGAKEYDLYQTRFGDYFWLNKNSCIDQSIISSGIWETHSTEVVKKIVKGGDIALDIGANTGYFTVMLSKLVGREGKVLAFEPTKHFFSVLEKNIRANDLKNCATHRLGLSNKTGRLSISIDKDTATMHMPEGVARIGEEKIQLTTLDSFVVTNKLKKIDFIKIDVDGHEPLFFEGAWKALEKFDPVILLEVSHLHFLGAGYTAWRFYKILKSKGYRIYSEQGLKELKNKTEFLIECGNFAYSANILISKRDLEINAKEN